MSEKPVNETVESKKESPEIKLPDKRPSIFKEFFIFLKEEKVWWISPIVIVLLLLSLFIIMTEGSAVLPFIYAVF